MSDNQVIPEAAVEAAAKEYNAKCFDVTWESLPDWARESRREDARGILEAAAPHMRVFPGGRNQAEWEKYLDSYR